VTDETRFSVLVSTDEGVNWKLHRAIIANTTEQACKRVQRAHYAEDVHALFYATQRFTPRKLVQTMVPKLDMQQVDLDEEPVGSPHGEQPMPHEDEPPADPEDGRPGFETRDGDPPA
jgi:hypothetical protein